MIKLNVITWLYNIGISCLQACPYPQAVDSLWSGGKQSAPPAASPPPRRFQAPNDPATEQLKTRSPYHRKHKDLMGQSPGVPIVLATCLHLPEPCKPSGVFFEEEKHENNKNANIRNENTHTHTYKEWKTRHQRLLRGWPSAKRPRSAMAPLPSPWRRGASQRSRWNGQREAPRPKGRRSCRGHRGPR